MLNDDYHVSVLLNTSVEGLVIDPSGTYVDVTFGGGGHSRKILELLDEKGRLFAFDQDADAAKNAIDDPRFHFIASNFSFLTNFLKVSGVKEIDGLIADLGVSSFQFDEESRGFSTRMDARLDMRMNQSQELDAYKVVNAYDEEELYRIFREYGEVKTLRKLVELILKNRAKNKIKTTGEFVNLLKTIAPRGKENRFYAQVFQAIRIEVNDEMKVLRSLLEQSAKMIKPGGRLVVISYHSLEDRLVKNFIKKGKFEGEVEKDFFGREIKPFKEVTRKPIIPDSEEQERNTRSRSAKLRIAEKVAWETNS
ncbi:MAG: 16S rRNA (cytosine(1402)-N(4))-methyltransferase RsmH [Crocinitomicaceae bacterium]|nr:16S rRNA (cytosine(1402)-N(4))-methyltransferase RsmH [Crocinitomicaceae bacterium]